VRRVNRDFPRVAKIRRFVSLYKELDADDDELTRTRKVRRGFVEERYRDVIEALYEPGLEELKVEAEIRYEDGREAKVRTAVRLVTVEGAECAWRSAVTGGAGRSPPRAGHHRELLP